MIYPNFKGKTAFDCSKIDNYQAIRLSYRGQYDIIVILLSAVREVSGADFIKDNRIYQRQYSLGYPYGSAHSRSGHISYRAQQIFTGYEISLCGQKHYRRARQKTGFERQGKESFSIRGFLYGDCRHCRYGQYRRRCYRARSGRTGGDILDVGIGIRGYVYKLRRKRTRHLLPQEKQAGALRRRTYVLYRRGAGAQVACGTFCGILHACVFRYEYGASKYDSYHARRRFFHACVGYGTNSSRAYRADYHRRRKENR